MASAFCHGVRALKGCDESDEETLVVAFVRHLRCACLVPLQSINEPKLF